jgi:hypothetical protein
LVKGRGPMEGEEGPDNGVDMIKVHYIYEYETS